MKITGKIMLYKYRWMSLVGIVSIMVILILYRVNRPSEILVSKDISSPVKIYRDAYGVPHIYADNMEDLFFGWGYAAAQDRMWQMELYRRKINGTYAEIFGEDLKDKDISKRTLGLKRYAELDLKLLEPGIKNLLGSYARGVNVYLFNNADRTKQFMELKYMPDPWTVVDILSLEKYFAWNFIDGGSTAIGQFLKRYIEENEEKLKEVLLNNYKHLPTSKNKNSLYQKSFAPADEEKIVLGSNCWVVDGNKSVSGKPLLANDPHTALLIPSYWHEVHLAIPKKNFHCAGISLPGGCIIYIGRTDNVAWGLTKSYIDCADTVVEKINPHNPDEYWDGKEWKSFTIHKEIIKVRDGDNVEIISRENKHGVNFRADTSTSTLNLRRWTGFSASRGTQSFLKAYQAQNVDEFIACLKPIKTPILNMHFADIEGNIAYHVIGHIPQRSFVYGVTPISGWEGKGVWTAFIPFFENPHVLNPKKHFVASANNRMVNDFYPYYLYNEYAPNYRYDRIFEYLSGKTKVDLQDMKTMQLDIYNVKAKEITPCIVRICKGKVNGKHYIQALEILEQWDYKYDMEAQAPAIFELFYKYFSDNIFKGCMDENTRKKVLKSGYRKDSIMRNIFKKKYSSWLDEDKEKAKKIFEEIVFDSFVEAIDTLVAQCGEDIKNWEWGLFHKVTLADFFPAGKDAPDAIAAFSRDGGSHTLCRGSGVKLDGKPSTFGASYRFIVDLNEDKILYYSCLMPGQSDDADSPHYKDQVMLWKRGKYKKVYRNIKDIVQEKHELLTILPEKEAMDDK